MLAWVLTVAGAAPLGIGEVERHRRGDRSVLRAHTELDGVTDHECIDGIAALQLHAA